MFRKLFFFLLAISFLLFACTVATNTPYPGVLVTEPASTTQALTPDKTDEPTTAPTVAPTATVTPEPSPTPIPTSVPGNFEFAFQPGFIPAELEAGGLGEVTFGIAQSAGGEISTEGMRSQNIIPLVKDGSILNAVSGNVVFLPFPEKMLTEDGQEVSSSVDQSGQGWAAYIDANGNLLRKMITRIPNAATIVAGVSFNSSDRGTVYALKLGSAGEVLGKARLVFDDQTALSVVFEAGEVAIDVNNQPSTPNFSNASWEVDLLRELENKLSAAGVVFTPDTTSHLETDYYGFTVRFSEGILKRSGQKYVRLHPEVMKRLFLQSMGQLLYFQRDLFPDRYESFYQIELIDYYTEDPSILARLAPEALEEGLVPFRFRSKDLSGSINSLKFNYVSKKEFEEVVAPILNTVGINHTLGPEWMPAIQDSEIAAFFHNNQLLVYTYTLGVAGDRKQDYWAPLEILYNDPGNLYFGIAFDWATTMKFLQEISGPPELWQYILWRGTYTREWYLFCIDYPETSGLVGCQALIKYTFTPGIPIPPTPIP